MEIQNELYISHDKENKTLFLRWGENYYLSEDYGDYVLDLNKNREVIGIELLHFDCEKEK